MVVLGALIVVAMLTLILLFTHRIRAGRPVFLRDIPGLASLPSLVGQAVESGQKIHLSAGTGGITGTKTMATLAGLAVLDNLAEKGCASGAPPVVTVADPMVLPAAQDSLRQAYGRHRRMAQFQGTQVEMIAPQPAIYALGASTRLNPEETAANVMIGSFGPEALLLAGPAARQGISQVAGTDDPQAMAVLVATADDPIIGEEMFAAPAYLGRKPAHLASLQAQDAVRIGVVVLILVAVILRTFLDFSLF